MSDHVLLNLSNVLGKRDKIPGLPSILSFYRFFETSLIVTKIHTFIYHMTLNLFSIRVFGMKMSRFWHLHVYTRATLLSASIHKVTNICKSLVVYRF